MSEQPTLDEVLMTIVIGFQYLIAHAPAEDLSPTLSVRMEEEISYHLKRLGLDDRRAFLAFIRQQAQASAWPEERAFLEQLPTLLGWEDGQ